MKRLRVLPLLIAVLLLLPACSKTKSSIELIEKDSFFSDFVISRNEVLFLCRLRIVNHSEKTMTVRITGDFRDDVKNGLIAERTLHGYAVDDETALAFMAGAPQIGQRTEEISLKSGQNEIWVVFVGAHGSGNQKNDRNLPQISIAPIND